MQQLASRLRYNFAGFYNSLLCSSCCHLYRKGESTKQGATVARETCEYTIPNKSSYINICIANERGRNLIFRLKKNDTVSSYLSLSLLRKLLRRSYLICAAMQFATKFTGIKYHVLRKFKFPYTVRLNQCYTVHTAVYWGDFRSCLFT